MSSMLAYSAEMNEDREKARGPSSGSGLPAAPSVSCRTPIGVNPRNLIVPQLPASPEGWRIHSGGDRRVHVPTETDIHVATPLHRLPSTARDSESVRSSSSNPVPSSSATPRLSPLLCISKHW